MRTQTSKVMSCLREGVLVKIRAGERPNNGPDFVLKKLHGLRFPKGISGFAKAMGIDFDIAEPGKLGCHLVL